MLKLYINESVYIKEDIEAVKKYYPNIDDNMFMNLIALDPTYRDGSNSVGKYGKWILNLYNKGNLSDGDMNDITDVLNQFTTYRNRIQNKDLNSYKSLSALEDTLASVIDDDSMLTDRQKLRFMKNVKAGRVKTSAEDDYDVVLETPKFIVCIPNTHEASMKLGKGTEWCTAHENPEWYEHYTKNGGKLYIVKDKHTGERWQYAESTGDFLNDDDLEFNVLELLQEDEKLARFFTNIIGIDLYTFNGTWYYDGKEIPKVLKSVITEIFFDSQVTTINSDAFRDCIKVEYIDIPPNVTIIGANAFLGCINLEYINLPSNLTTIGRNAFADCTNLKSITIPNSVTSIEAKAFDDCIHLETVYMSKNITEFTYGMFRDCYLLTSINIPNGVTDINAYVFRSCYNLKEIILPNSISNIADNAIYNCNALTVQTDNDYVISYCKRNGIPTKPLTHTESYKLHIKEGNYI